MPGLLLFLWASFLVVSCTGGPTPAASRQPLQVSLYVDGETYNLTTGATNVRELLEEAGITTAAADRVEPPPFTPLQDGMSVTVTRVEEELLVVEETLPFARKIVRSDTMSADDPPRIIQGGRAGLQEITVRVVYHDGAEVERQRTQVTQIEAPQDEIVMVGVGAAAGSASFPGTIAYLSGGNPILLRGSTALPVQLPTGSRLDGRVFSLSPSGSHLLYTRVTSDTGRFNNSLWLLSTERGAEPRPLGVENVLWAGWNPNRAASLQIAYSTADPVDQPPGWEANNDLWLATVFANEEYPFEPEQIVETYPATYGWWGGNYAWSPDGQYLAYSHADEVGVLDLEETGEDQRRQLHTFTEYNTRADWVWLPSLTWAPDGRFLAFTSHGGANAEAMVFDTWVADVESGISSRFVEQSGMWAHPHWSPPLSGADQGASQIAFLQATTPLDSLRSTYTLWMMDADGSNRRQAYPPVGENSRLPREWQFMSWGPSGRDLAFIFDNALYLLNLDRDGAFRVTQDDAVASRPTWAPYGAAVTEESASGRILPFNARALQDELVPLLPDEP